MTEIVFSGIRVVSKKNNRRNFGHVSLPSKAFEKFKNLMYEHLYPFSGAIHGPFKISVWVGIKGKYSVDLDNTITSLLDVLQDYRVIDNDKDCEEIHGYRSRLNKDWKYMIRLEEL